MSTLLNLFFNRNLYRYAKKTKNTDAKNYKNRNLYTSKIGYLLSLLAETPDVESNTFLSRMRESIRCIG